MKLLLIIGAVLAAVGGAYAQQTDFVGPGDVADGPSILVPESSIARPQDRGWRAHTNYVLAEPSAAPSDGVSLRGGLGPKGGMTPAQLRSFYNLPSTGGSEVIAIVGAYHYATALSDFNVFSKQFGLPVEKATNVLANTNKVFQIVYATGAKPGANAGWAQEAALDIEWAHAMAPSAKIVLVEAKSSGFNDLFAAVDKARSLPGVRQISMSWGGMEFSGQTNFDTRFVQNNGIVYFASSGDTGGIVSYPASSPNVVAVGGTRVVTNSLGAFVDEVAWSGSGGGISAFSPKPTYQASLPHARRAVPDIAANADPNTGVAVYCMTKNLGKSGWLVFGGTSASAPCVAGMTNLAASRRADTLAQLNVIYAGAGGNLYRDTVSGTAGAFSTATGWDPVTGVGSPKGVSAL